MRHAEKYLQQLLIGYLRRIEMDAHRFGVTGIAVADLLVMRGGGIPASIARFHSGYPLDMFEHRVHPPETAAGKYRRLAGWFCPGV
jgi:murein endopeptidase